MRNQLDIFDHEPAGPVGLNECPITGLPFYDNMEHPEHGLIAMYGGPLDVYSVPELQDKDGELRRERYDLDADCWVEGGEPLGYFYGEQQPDDARQPVGSSFQAGVAEWMGQCFLPSLYSNMTERGDRLLEEVLELLQAHGYDKARVPTLVDYVFGRPVGDPTQEVGGVMVTLAGYCWVAGLDMHAAGDAELARINQPHVMAKIRAKQEAKNALHFDTPLPGNAAAPAPAQAVPLGRWSQWHADDLHVAVHTALSVHAGSLSQKKRAAISAYVKRLLIDSQAVGNG